MGDRNLSITETPQSVLRDNSAARALSRALQAEPPVITPIPGKKLPTKSSKSRRVSVSPAVQADENDEAASLGAAILQNLGTVRVTYSGSMLEFEACVTRTASALAVLVGDKTFSWQPPEDVPLTVMCDEGTLTCVYLGMRVTFGLRATMLGFIILA